MNKIPLFPINVAVLPFELLPLHIFEERYKKMVSNSLKNNFDFGIIYRENKEIRDIGCLVSIEKVYKKYKDGKYDILVQGKNRFKIVNSFKEKDNLLYAEIELLNECYDQVDKNEFSRVLDKYLKLLLMLNIDHDIQSEINKNISFDFTKNILIPNNIKQEFLELENELQRIDFINNFLDSIAIKAKDNKNQFFNGQIMN